MSAKRFKVWLTKYALTQGVFLKDVEDCGDDMVADRGKYTACYHGEGRDWHRTRESALRRVEEMRAAAIKAAKRKLDKLTTMRIEVP